MNGQWSPGSGAEAKYNYHKSLNEYYPIAHIMLFCRLSCTWGKPAKHLNDTQQNIKQ